MRSVTLKPPSLHDMPSECAEVTAFAPERSKTGTASRWLVQQRVLLCLLAHLVLIAYFAVFNSFSVSWTVALPHNLLAGRFQTIVTVVLTIVGTVRPLSQQWDRNEFKRQQLYTAFLLGLTQSLALRRNYGERQSLTMLHDRTHSWLGLWASILVLLKQRRFSGRLILTLVYLLLLFGVHNLSPALLVVSPRYTDAGRHTTAEIVEMTPFYHQTYVP
jgi:hypothetical protein